MCVCVSEVVACAISRIRLDWPENGISAITLMVTAQYCMSSAKMRCVCVRLSIHPQLYNAQDVYIHFDNKTSYCVFCNGWCVAVMLCMSCI